MADRGPLADLWTEFWVSQGPGSSCFQAGTPDVWRPLISQWSSFASTLAPEARVLDVGCGAGVVGRLLIGTQPNLRVVGIDIAKVPSAVEPQLELVSEVRMEALPFPQASFEAAVSQFGYEYCDLQMAAAELARVLKSGSNFSFVVHHSLSRLVRNGRARRAAIVDLTSERMRSAIVLGNNALFDEWSARLSQKYPGFDIVTQAVRLLRLHLSRSDAQRLAAWRGFVDAIAVEHSLLKELDYRCVDEGFVENWLAPLRPYFELHPVSVIKTSGENSEPIGWRIQGVRCG